MRVEQGLKRVRGFLGGQVVVDTTAVRLVWEKPYYPTWYFPLDDVSPGVLQANGRTRRSPSRGQADLYDVAVGDRTIADAAYRHPDSPLEELRELVAFDFGALDAWFEEDEEVFVHPRDPYSRVDILPTSRHVRIEVDGVTVADSHHARFLFETGLPVRRYLPKTDVRFDLLEATETETRCPYKGTARYWSLHLDDTVHDDLVWSYPSPVEESQRIAGLVCFWDERVDTYVDGVLQERPVTPFSKPASD